MIIFAVSRGDTKSMRSLQNILNFVIQEYKGAINMIEIMKSSNSEDLSFESLREDTYNHTSDVQKGLTLWENMLDDAGWAHDFTKKAYMEEFYEALTSGDNVKDSKWYKLHISRERHHLMANPPDDVNLIDVLEQLTDCVMAGLTRSGKIYDIDLPNELLQKAYKNTIELLKSNVKVMPFKEEVE